MVSYFPSLLHYFFGTVSDECLRRYLAIIEVCETVQIPCPLPVFDLGTKIFPAPKQKKSA